MEPPPQNDHCEVPVLFFNRRLRRQQPFPPKRQRMGRIVFHDKPSDPDIQQIPRLQGRFEHGSAVDEGSVLGTEIANQKHVVDTVNFTMLAAHPAISDSNVGLLSTSNAKRKVGEGDFTARNERIFGDQFSSDAHGRVTCGKDSVTIGGTSSGGQSGGRGKPLETTNHSSCLPLASATI